MAYVIVDPAHEYIITTYELCTDELIRGEDRKITKAWPTGLPPIDGAYVCYDASNIKSFTHVPDILSTFSLRATA